jgi:hypothetical protein
MCRDQDNDEHARRFTHETRDIPSCRDGSTDCTKLGDPEHRANYRHNGLPYFMTPCRNGQHCTDRSMEHLKKFKHSTSFNQASYGMIDSVKDILVMTCELQ